MEAGLAPFLGFLRQAWTALAGALLAFILLAGMARLLRVNAGTVLGANLWVQEAASALLSLLVLALFAFLGVPQIVRALSASLPGGAGCGPISELGAFASGLIGGLAGLRMLKAAFASVVSTSLGGASAMSHALMEAGEAVFGMLLAGAAVPLAGWFLGAC
jgi:hypothetical protein